MLHGMEVASTLMRGNATNSNRRILVLSGPVVALAGGILLARSVRNNRPAEACAISD